MATLVMWCLEKKRADRSQRAEELLGVEDHSEQRQRQGASLILRRQLAGQDVVLPLVRAAVQFKNGE